jgi:hypothetical protein
MMLSTLLLLKEVVKYIRVNLKDVINTISVFFYNRSEHYVILSMLQEQTTCSSTYNVKRSDLF